MWCPDDDQVYETKHVEFFENINGYEALIKQTDKEHETFTLQDVFLETESEEDVEEISDTESESDK